MYDKYLINKVCDLTCTKEDVCRDQSIINYDHENPFKKYYDIDIIVGAINKYLSKEWDAQTFAGWACIYNWILCGGFHDDLKENLNSFEVFIKEVISWNLDGLSFFDEDYLEDDESLEDWIPLHKNWDHVLQTQEGWKAAYAMVGEFAEFNEDQYVVIFNDELKEYMIIHSDHLENGFEDERFKYITEEAFIDLIEQLKEEEFNILSCDEKWYYMDISEEDEE